MNISATEFIIFIRHMTILFEISLAPNQILKNKIFKQSWFKIDETVIILHYNAFTDREHCKKCLQQWQNQKPWVQVNILQYL